MTLDVGLSFEYYNNDLTPMYQLTGVQYSFTGNHYYKSDASYTGYLYWLSQKDLMEHQYDFFTLSNIPFVF